MTETSAPNFPMYEELAISSNHALISGTPLRPIHLLKTYSFYLSTSMMRSYRV